MPRGGLSPSFDIAMPTRSGRFGCSVERLLLPTTHAET